MSIRLSEGEGPSTHNIRTYTEASSSVWICATLESNSVRIASCSAWSRAIKVLMPTPSSFRLLLSINLITLTPTGGRIFTRKQGCVLQCVCVCGCADDRGKKNIKKVPQTTTNGVCCHRFHLNVGCTAMFQ